MKEKTYLDLPTFTLRGKLGRIIVLVGGGQIDDPNEDANRGGFVDSYARDALTVAWVAVNDLRMALDELNDLERRSGVSDYTSRAKSLIFSAISRMGRDGDEGEI